MPAGYNSETPVFTGDTTKNPHAGWILELACPDFTVYSVWPVQAEKSLGLKSKPKPYNKAIK
jgi:hypothetical protein